MRVTCPCCGAMHELDTLVQHDYGRRAVVAAAHLPPALFAQTMRYLRLFVSPNAPQRALTMDRAATLLDGLVQAVNAGVVAAKGREWSAPLTAWPGAFEAVFDQVAAGTVKLPLKSHAYLFGVIANQTNAVEAKAEAATEQQRRSPIKNQTPAAFKLVAAPTGASAEIGEISTSAETDAPPPLNGGDSEKVIREVPAYFVAALAKLGRTKSMAAAAALPDPDAPVPNALIGCMAEVTKGKWKGRGGKVVRILNDDELALSIHFPKNGERVIVFKKSELSL